MSRHKLVKALDLDEELDDFDGGAESDYDEEIDVESKERLRIGTLEVRNVLGDNVSVTNKEIEDSLWHYYYDVEKTVNYLLNQKSGPRAKNPKKPVLSADEGVSKAGLRFHHNKGEPDQLSKMEESCDCKFSAADFFRDSPWLNVPHDRIGEILIESLHPRGGLLGGTSRNDSAPKSKLATLAAARKAKENQKVGNNQNTTASVALLDKLGGRSRGAESKYTPASQVKPELHASPGQKRQIRKRGFAALTADGAAHEESKQADDTAATSPVSPPGVPVATVPDHSLSAAPSIFARTMFQPFEKHQDSALPNLHSFSVEEILPVTKFDFLAPSPDDVVLKAQNAKTSTSKPLKQEQQLKDPTRSVNDVTQAVEGVSIEGTRVKGKNLNVLAEFEKSKPKNAANFVVIGHVDAGKSTLMGRLLYDLKVVEQRTIDRYRREADRMGKSSFALAWVLDQGTEERERGVTIDVAMNKFETENTAFTILDAPGHRDFIPNMIAGASQADFAVLVIDASTGNFESGLKGQTKEHTLLIRSLGVQRIVIAVNKLDTVQWSQDRFDEISQQISAFLTSAGFSIKNFIFVPCSGLTGENIVRGASDPNASWYQGPPLITLLESSEPVARALDKSLRLTIDDVFRGGVQNPLSIAGRLDAGSIQIGDNILIAPTNQAAVIKGIEIGSEPKDWAVAGQNVVLHLADIEAQDLKPGDVVCSPLAPVQSISTFTVKALAFEHVTPMHCEIHKGRLHAPGRVTNLMALIDKASGAVIKGKKPRMIKPGSVGKVMIEVDHPVPLEKGARVVIRAAGATVAAGLLE